MKTKKMIRNALITVAGLALAPILLPVVFYAIWRMSKGSLIH